MPEIHMSIYDAWAKCYDLSEGDRSEIVNFYTNLVTPAMRSLLELGCGTGVIVTALAQRMACLNKKNRPRVIGLDRSTEMLRIARSRNRHIAWVAGDFRAPPIGGAHDLVVCCFNALQMLLSEDELSASFDSVRRILAPDGLFVFDIYQPNLAYLQVPQTDRLVRAITDEQGRTVELRENAFYDFDRRILHLDWRLIQLGSCTETVLGRLYNRVRQYFPAETEQMLLAAGLAIKERFGDFDRSPFTSESKKQIIVCTAQD
jgi:SAM-dependent methyltransferase